MGIGKNKASKNLIGKICEHCQVGVAAAAAAAAAVVVVTVLADL